MITSATLTLKEVFSSFRSSPWYFIRPGGNWGDYLIYAGAEQLAKDLGIPFETLPMADVTKTDFSENACLYVHGGGGYNTWCSGTPFDSIKDAVQQKVQIVVQGPCSLEEEVQQIAARLMEAVDSRRCQRTLFFVREKTSLKAIREIDIERSGVEVYLDKDTAFHLSADHVIALAGLRPDYKKKYHLVVRREDKEAPDRALASHNRLLAARLDPANDCANFQHWLKVHAQAKSITTNRLHSAIVGSILGTPVYLSRGSYHKNCSVWEYTLRNSSVTWIADEQAYGFNPLSWVPQRIRHSVKVNRAVRRFFRVPGF